MKRFLKITGIVVGVIVLLIAVLTGYAYYKMKSVKDTHDLQDKVAAACNKYIKEGKAPGIFVGIIQGDRVYMHGYGVMDKDSKIPVDSTTIFEIGSISKVFTAELTQLLVEKGELNWDDNIIRYLPAEVKWKDDTTTLKHLATHTSGFPRLPEVWFKKLEQNECDPYTALSINDLFAYLNDPTEKKRPSPENFDYSNVGAGLLGHILEWKMNLSYEQMLQEMILHPLGMLHTSAIGADSAMFATGYNEQGNKTCHWNFPILYSAGSIRSSGADMMRFLAANMKNSSPLSASFTMTHKQAVKEAPIALGWHIDMLSGIFARIANITWHNGGTGGFRSYIGFVPGKDRGVIVMANQSDECFDEMAVDIMVDAATVSLK
ncbi:MAG: serine hydrolase [Flavipsychrobacter sp.]|nr:serine hydrolase [Flavipsychrobacter sp.]